MAIIDDETGVNIPPGWWIRYVHDSEDYMREILEARKENFKRLGIKP